MPAGIVAATLLPFAPMSSEAVQQQRTQILSGVVTRLLEDLKTGVGDKDRRRQVEEWMRTLAEKYPEFHIEIGLRDYYLAEAERLRADFDKSSELTEKLGLGRNIESFLDRAAEYDRRITDRG
jgi:type II secretory pathway pseudopilin PulG